MLPLLDRMADKGLVMDMPYWEEVYYPLQQAIYSDCTDQRSVCDKR